MAKPKDKESDAGREYAEIWGETIHSNNLVAWIIPKDVLSLCFSTLGIT